MAKSRVLQRSFGGGEISPEMYGRVDDQRYHTGAAKMLNVVTKPQGIVRNRPGFAYVNTVKSPSKKTRLIPFTYSTTQTMVLELGENYIRFHTNGSTLLAPASATAYQATSTTVSFTTSTNLVTWTGHGFANGDQVIFLATNLPPTVSPFTPYYVINVSGSTFQITSTYPGGTALSFASASNCTGNKYYKAGDLTSSGGNLYYAKTNVYGYTPPDANYWYLLTFGGAYEIPTTYAQADLFDIHYVQSNDVVTLVHPNYPPAELRRLSATAWTFTAISFASPISAPGNPTVTPTYGLRNTSVKTSSSNTLVGATISPVQSRRLCIMVGGTNFSYIASPVLVNHGYAENDIIYLSGGHLSHLNDKYFIIDTRHQTNAGTASNPYNAFTLRYFETGEPVIFDDSTTTNATGNLITANGLFDNNIPRVTVGQTIMFATSANGLSSNTTYYILSASAGSITVGTSYPGTPVTLTNSTQGLGPAIIFPSYTTSPSIPTSFTAYTSNPSESLNKYKVTAVDSSGNESPAVTSPASATNNLYVTGAYNTISWNAVTGAVRYNIYKFQTGLYGYIGQTEYAETTFRDTNIAPDMGTSLPIYETVFSSVNNYPGAVSYFEQRRCFAGTNNSPQGIWMTRSNTESDMSYSLPIVDTDRIYFQVAARESNRIRHIVPFGQLLLLTNSAEWRVQSVNSDAITPTSISVRPQSYVGANNVQPSMVNTSMVYCAARGGHVRELSYSWQANGYVTGDLSLRAAHLFDDYTLSDMCYGKAPFPIFWFVSSSGKLMSMTYVPEEQVVAWHQQQTGTNDVFESCTTVSEGDEDRLYVVVKRMINGSATRYIERMASMNPDVIGNSWFVDSGVLYDGTSTDASTMTVSLGSSWKAGETLHLTCSASKFTAGTDIGNAIVITHTDGVKYTFTIKTIYDNKNADVVCDLDIPASLRNVAVSTYGKAVRSFTGAAHLAASTIAVFADGVVLPQTTTTQAGAFTIDTPAVKVLAGLPYVSEVQTLPIAVQVDGLGQGRQKNVNNCWVRVLDTAGVTIGPNSDRLVPLDAYASEEVLDSGEIQVLINPSWNKTSQVLIRQSNPLPMTINGLTIEVVLGG